MLGKREIQEITNAFYSKFCGMDVSMLSKGIHFICMPERGEIVKGFGCRYTIYMLVSGERTVIAYAPEYHEKMGSIKELPEKEVVAAIRNNYEMKEMKLLIFEEEKLGTYGDARILQSSDYPLFELFFRTTNPEADLTGWLEEYFMEKVEKGYFSGYFKDGRLICVCDAPDMPFMEGQIQHTGITTIAEERGKSYGKLTAALATHNLLAKGICPQWECDAQNIASYKLAQAIGYEEFGTAYIFEEWD